ncbi:MAG: hypothetical protein ABIA37_04110 [Candidatus Woesearchaeota archaeon]
MEKKGIMLKFLVTLILAIIIFVPACSFAAKFLSVSTQAKNNFQDFTNQLVKISSEPGKNTTEILIMDENTALIYFEKAQTEVLVDVDAEPPTNEIWIFTDYQLVFKKPSACSEGKNCLCLFREPSSDADIKQKKVMVTSSAAICNPLDFDLRLDNCSIGYPVNINSYTCRNGFMIERKLVANSEINKAYYEITRRNSINIYNDKGTIILKL